MRPMIVDADKLEENIKHPFSKVSEDERIKSDIAEMILDTLVPYEDKKEIPSILYGNGCGGTKDARCTWCNGDGKLMNQWDKATCVHCNGTGKEPRKEQDTRTHAWETPVSKQTYYSQDEVRKMLEDLKDSTIKHDSTDSASEEYYINGYNASTNEMNANIDKKIAEL